MNWLRRSLGVVAVGATVTLAGTACEKNESMLFIVGVLDVDRSDCVARPEGEAVIKSGGILDVSLRGGYRAALLVGSHLTQRGSRDQLRTETARFALQGAEVTLTDISGNLLPIDSPNPYSTIGTGFVNPSGSEEAGYGVMFADIVPASVEIPDGTVVSHVRAFGTTLGGAELESNELIFQIQVCHGCLISYPASAADLDRGATDCYYCQVVSEEESDVELSACFPGQDSPVPCTYCSPYNNACEDPCQNCSVRQNDSRCVGTAIPPECADE